MHKVGDHPRLYYDARSTNHQVDKVFVRHENTAAPSGTDRTVPFCEINSNKDLNI